MWMPKKKYPKVFMRIKPIEFGSGLYGFYCVGDGLRLRRRRHKENMKRLATLGYKLQQRRWADTFWINQLHYMDDQDKTRLRWCK